MSARVAFYIFFLVIGLQIVPVSIVSATDRKPLPAKRAFANFTRTPPQIDGKVDKIWLTAPPNKGFRQRSPDQGLPATNGTRFYVLYDDKNVYFLFIMLDKDWQDIPARLVDRDYHFYPDDSINFYLDSYNDNRKAFYFSTNPRGVEQDGLISENGDKVDLTWDGIFRVSAGINKFGWVAEFSIPYKTLRFQDNLKYQIWGFNVWRVRKKSREVSYWSLVDQNFQLFRLDRGGVLIGMKGVKSGQHLNFFPYVTGKQAKNSVGTTDYSFKPGVDVKYNPTSNITLDLTLNPDFGQVEIDEEQINLDKRFEIQLEEKRPFFLENKTLFQTPFYQLFYSRRIGAQSDLKGGIKGSGKVGKFSFGGLVASTGDWDNWGLGDSNTPPPEEFFSVFRVQRDILASSNIGLMLVDREENPGGTSNQSNRVGGIDWSVYRGQQYFIGQTVLSGNSFDHSTGFAAYSQLGHYDQLFWLDLHAHYYQPDFDINGTGFFLKIPNKGQKQIGLYADTHPLINRGWIRSWGVSISPTIIRDSDESKTSWGVQGSVWLETPDQSRLKLGYSRYKSVENDILNLASQPFETIYWGRDIFARVETDPGKLLSLSLKWNYDSQYYFQTRSVGFNEGIEAKLHFKPLSNGFLELGHKRVWFFDDQMVLMPNSEVGQSDVRIWTLRGRYLFTKNLFSRGFLQYTTGGESFVYQIDSFRNRFFPSYAVWNRTSANLLLGWRFQPGSTAYLVFTQEWDDLITTNLSPVNRVLFFKFSYFWSL